jgi:hypothetical protein
MLHVTPLSASLRLGDQVLSQVNFPSPAEQEKAAGAMTQAATDAKASRLASVAAEKEALAAKAEAEKTNAERQQRRARAEAESQIAQKQTRPPGAFGRDIAKVQLGMTIEQADATIRQQTKVAAVVELKAGTWGYTPTLMGRRIYASCNGTDMLTVYMLPQAGNRVVGISRSLALPLPALTKEEASKLLTDKYGASSADGNGGLYWTDDLEALGPLSSPCRNIDDDNQTRGYVTLKASWTQCGLIGVTPGVPTTALIPTVLG